VAESVTYITDAELLQLGLPGDALIAVDVAVRDEARKAASDRASAAFKKHHTLPITAWGADVKRSVAHVAAYDLMVYRGFDPSSESGQLIVKRHDDAIQFFRDVARGILEPVDLVDSSADTDELSPLVSSDSVAGWSWPTTTEGT